MSSSFLPIHNNDGACGVRGREAREWGQAVGNALALSRGCPHGPRGAGRSEGLVHELRGPVRIGRGGRFSPRAALERRWITLISVGWLPPDFTSSRSCLCLVARVGGYGDPPRIARTRVLLTGRPRPECLILDAVLADPGAPCSDRRPGGVGPPADFAGDRPDEPRQPPTLQQAPARPLALQ